MLATLATKLSSHPRRTLLFGVVFLLIAGVIGGPVAGKLTSSGGFAPANSDSEVAKAMIERASGTQGAAGIVLLVHTPEGPSAASARIAALKDRLAAVPGVATVAGPAGVSRDGRHVLITGTLRAGAEEHPTAKAAVAAFSGDRDVVVGGPVVAGEQINSTVTKDLGFAEALAFPLLLVLALIFFRGRATLMPLIVGVTTVLGTFLVLRGVNELYGLSIFALNLVIGMGLGLSIDYTPLPRHALPRRSSRRARA